MILLDTDIFTVLSYPASREKFPNLVRRVEQQRESVSITAVTADEVLRGALALIRKEETKGQGVEGYRLLIFLLNQLAQYPVVPFTESANNLFRGYSPALKRNGVADCKIAAVAQINNALIITRNIRHFSQIPDARYEDWTVGGAED